CASFNPSFFIFCLPLRRPPTSPLFPYTTLFRSVVADLVVIDDPVIPRGRLPVVQPIEHTVQHAVGVPLGVPDRQTEVAVGLAGRSEEHTSELQSRENLVCRLLLEKKNKSTSATT